jgi:hypothetical protein
VALLCWLHCDILVVFVDNSRKDVLANIMVQLPSLGDISPDRNVDAVDYLGYFSFQSLMIRGCFIC